ncbi:uncharacterized protein MELLADRAFT_72489 [Melampsora larici-populina 98AG31]|uniref:Thioredoxin n=1 Tax=Melampsora larici-populina (strain 98AG31 / pathotype 3-4-7) TaxID=747676 RepID=F4RUP4_MELLP|nr:uncharacterized protein MELLADRAFT_72489 [Melampsora larici-populina 98AG31]EGG03887.1 hypothetical protein MELLADRAFT_72489 [Melampsora larici-populina 98AG31]
MPSVEEISSNTEFQKAIETEKVTIVDFWAPWCGPCKVISPVFEKLAEEDTSCKVKFCKVNIDSLPDVASQYGIRAIPTFMTFVNAEKSDVVSGAGVAQLTEFINRSTGV